jgi:hypothetical protein
VSDLFHYGGHKSFAFINASLHISLLTAFDAVGSFCLTGNKMGKRNEEAAGQAIKQQAAN